MHQPKDGRLERPKVEPGGVKTESSKDIVAKSTHGAVPRKCGFHSGIKFIGNPKKSTQFKPFSFDGRTKSLKVSAAKEMEIQPLSPASRSKSEMALNTGKIDEKPVLMEQSPKPAKAENIKKTELKPLYFELCPEAEEAICQHGDGRTCESLFAKAFVDCLLVTSHSTPISKQVSSPKVSVVNPFGFEIQEKTEKTQDRNARDVKLVSSKVRQKEEKVKNAKETDVKRSGSNDVKYQKVTNNKETAQEVKLASCEFPLQTEKALRKNYRAHSGLKFIPRKKGTVVQPFSFENRLSTLKPNPESTKQDIKKEDK